MLRPLACLIAVALCSTVSPVNALELKSAQAVAPAGTLPVASVVPAVKASPVASVVPATKASPVASVVPASKASPVAPAVPASKSSPVANAVPVPAVEAAPAEPPAFKPILTMAPAFELISEDQVEEDSASEKLAVPPKTLKNSTPAVMPKSVEVQKAAEVQKAVEVQKALEVQKAAETSQKPAEAHRTAGNERVIDGKPVVKHTTCTKVGCGKQFHGMADYYHHSFYGKRTASGKVLHKHVMTAAHRTLPFGTKVRVTNKTNGKTCIVVVNDRGPFTPSKVIDLSHAAALDLDMIRAGTARVICEVVE